MQSPLRLTLVEFRIAIRQFLDLECLQFDKALWCRKCGGSIAYSKVRVAIQDSAFEGQCVSSNGWLWTLFVPYCPFVKPCQPSEVVFMFPGRHR